MEHKYQIAWSWRGADENERIKHDDIILKVRNAESAVRKLRKNLREEYSMTSKDVIIHEVYLL